MVGSGEHVSEFHALFAGQSMQSNIIISENVSHFPASKSLTLFWYHMSNLKIHMIPLIKVLQTLKVENIMKIKVSKLIRILFSIEITTI